MGELKAQQGVIARLENFEFEGVKWSPTDDIEVLMDLEVYRLGEYRDVEFYASREDIRPFNQLFTKFSRNKFRLFVRSEGL